MQISKIVSLINQKLAGEHQTYAKLQAHMDAVIDDINTKLNSIYPAFSELDLSISDYNFFPDRWIRMVIVPGVAYKFFIVDEEGIDAAPAFGMEYDNNLFLMVRDYFAQVPALYRAPDPSVEGTISLDTETRGLVIDGAYFHG